MPASSVVILRETAAHDSEVRSDRPDSRLGERPKMLLACFCLSSLELCVILKHRFGNAFGYETMPPHLSKALFSL